MPAYGSGIYGAGLYGGAGGPTIEDESTPDGKLQARYLSNRRGVLLRANFAQQNIDNWDFEVHDHGVTALGTNATVARSTVSPITGTGSLLLSWTSGTGTRGIQKNYGTDFPVLGPKMLRFEFDILTTDPQTIIPTPRSQEDYWSLRVAIYDQNLKLIKQRILPRPGLNTLRQNWYADFYLDAGKRLARWEVKLDNTIANKQVKFDNMRVIDLSPPKVRFTRKTYGDRVRGGDPASVVNGIAYAYDDELEPGVFTQWYAEPIYPDGDIGLATNVVGIDVEDRAPSEPSHLVKSVETPGLLMYLMTNQKQVSRSRQATFVNKQTTGKPAGGITSAYSMAGEYKLIITTAQELADLQSILDESVLFVQPSGRYNRKPFYATAVGYSVSDVGRMDDTTKVVEMTFQEVERPDTLGQPNYLPFRDYNWLSTFISYQQLADAGLTYDQLAFSTVP
jgi:hypothetical protein